jgi:glutaconate CoA-transferase subunit A
MLALPLVVAFVLLTGGVACGNAQFLGPDFYFDVLFLLAAQKRFVTCEKLVETKDLLAEGSLHTLRINRTMVDGVIEAPGGAHFTECPPDYGRDELFQREYAASAKDEVGWQEFKAEWLDVSESEYQAKLRERGAR